MSIINRRDFVKATGLSLAVLTMPGCLLLSNSAKHNTKKPNIIYIMADDLGYADLGCYGQTKIKTPNIDKIASGGMKFTQHYAGTTVCAPSRCSLMTGLHTGHAFIRGNKEVQPEGQWPMPAGTVTVANILQNAGYTTGMFGKWGLGGLGTEGEPNKQGFDHFFGYNCQRQAHSFYPQHLWRNTEKVMLDGNADGKRETYAHDLIVDEGLKFIDKNKDKPFFLYLPYTIPHAELAVPEDSLRQYKGKFPEKPFPGGHYYKQETPRAAYAAMVTRMDGYVGKVMAKLKALGIDNNTIVMFTSDNGPHGEGGNDRKFFDSNGPLRGMKRDLYEGGIRVPLVVRWPGKIKAGTVSEHISAFWDLMPTCTELVGANTPDGIDGISYVPTLLGKKQTEHQYLYWEFHERGGKQALRMGNFKAVRLNVRKKPNGPIELYDLNNDIGETNNIAQKHPAIIEKMAKIMKTARIDSSVFRLYD